MMRSTRLLALLLQLVGWSGLLATGAVLMPFEWMVQVHAWLGLAMRCGEVQPTFR